MTDKEKTDNESQGIIAWILSLFGMGDQGSDKKRLLKALAKEISNSKYKFYKPKHQEALPGLAKMFYEIYKVIAPAQVFLNNASQSGVLKSFVIDIFLTDDQKKQQDLLSAESIMEKSKNMQIKVLEEKVRSVQNNFIASFDSEKTRSIDESYSSILTLLNFINFDYFFLLKKFDSNVSERNFSYNPKFEIISGDYVADDITDFLEVFLPLNLDADWKKIFTALKEYKNVDVVQIDSWQKILPALREVRNSKILESIVMHVKQDPGLVITPKVISESIVEPYLERMRSTTENTIKAISTERRNSKIDEIVNTIFGTTVVVRCKNYLDKANLVFEKKNQAGYLYTAPINYLKAYLLDYFKKDIREIVDVLVIRGEWSTTIQSQQLSDTFHTLMDLIDKILNFDESLSEDNELGSRLKNAMQKADREISYQKILRQILSDTNSQALKIINASALGMIALGRHLKSLIDDLNKQLPEIVLNWKEVEIASGVNLKEVMTDNYKRLYYMVQLMQFYVKADK